MRLHSPHRDRARAARLSAALGAGVLAVALAIVVAVVVDRTVGEQIFGSGVDSTAAPVDPSSVPNPFAAGEPVPDGYFQVVGRDFIRPIYEPRFVAADDVGWPDDADVIGVEIDGEAKAYPVGLLTGSEMVIDEIAGVPILVSW